MAIELTEELVAAMAPADKAVLDGRGLIRKGAFRALAKSEDGSIVFADCAGSGSTPYKVSLDLASGGDRPTARCSCPSRQQPCKHALGLMLAFIAKGADFKVAPAPADVLEKRAKEAAKVKKAEGAESAPAKPRTVNKAAQAKKAEAQTDALDTLEKFVLDLVTAGLGSLNARSAKSIQEQAKRMADADLQGARALLLRLAALAGAKDEGASEERHARMAALVTQLWVAIRKGRKVLEGKAEDGDSQSESDAQVESLLGRRWQLPELKEAGYWTQGRTLLELAHERTEDEVLQMAVATGYLLDLEDGSIPMERTALPHAALNSSRDVKLRSSRTGVLTVTEAALYPGEVLNRRIRWEDKGEAVSERSREAQDYARVHTHARQLEPAIKSFREQLKNPLAPQDAVVLLAAARFGLTDDDRVVMEDSAGARLVFRDPPEARYPTTANLRHAAGAFGPGSVAVRLWFDPRERAIYGQALALIVGEKHLRLGL